MAKNFAELANEVLNPEAAPTAAPAPTPARTKSNIKVWLNLGVTLPVEQEDGTMLDTFISIPMGVPLDTMEPMVAKGDNKQNNRKIEVGNMYMEMLQTWAETDVSAGESLPLPYDIEVQARRVKEQGTTGTSASGGTNPLIAELHKYIKLVK